MICSIFRPSVPAYLKSTTKSLTLKMQILKNVKGKRTFEIKTELEG